MKILLIKGFATNSDATIYGGANVGNGGVVLPVNNGQINAIIPAHGFVVFEKVS
jgi:1,4-alpha-glucan branching enzyme